jgi:inner membrane protein involved in colicin E2 resistance
MPFRFDGKNNERVVLALSLAPKETKTVEIRFNSRGLDEWRYFFANGTGRANDLKLKVVTNFDEIDFPPGTLSPTAKEKTASGWVLNWRFENLLSGAHLAIAMPQKINPGPLASEISFFAPVSLVFFIGMILLLSLIKKVRLHPVHFAMLAASFFSFHLLFAYLVDHVSWWVAFAISSATSLGLVISYLRLIVGAKFAILWAGGGQLFYLVLFSLAFCWKGYTGLTITVFSILSLFLLMQLTAHIDWFQRFSKAKPDAGNPPAPAAYHEVG